MYIARGAKQRLKLRIITGVYHPCIVKHKRKVRNKKMNIGWVASADLLFVYFEQVHCATPVVGIRSRHFENWATK